MCVAGEIKPIFSVPKRLCLRQQQFEERLSQRLWDVESTLRRAHAASHERLAAVLGEVGPRQLASSWPANSLRRQTASPLPSVGAAPAFTPFPRLLSAIRVTETRPASVDQ